MNAVQRSQAIREAVMKLGSVQYKATLKNLCYEMPDDTDSSSSDSDANSSVNEDSRFDQLVSEQIEHPEDRSSCDWGQQVWWNMAAILD